MSITEIVLIVVAVAAVPYVCKFIAEGIEPILSFIIWLLTGAWLLPANLRETVNAKFTKSMNQLLSRGVVALAFCVLIYAFGGIGI